ncbi:hypothetical protein KXJ55_23890, partial [Escherichia coli]
HWGYPAGVRVQVPMSAVPVADTLAVPWSLQQARVPVSSPRAADDAKAGGHERHGGHGGHAGHEGHEGPAVAGEHEGHGAPAAAPAGPQPMPAVPPIGLDAAMAAFTRLGLAPGFSVAAPQGAGGVYT